MEFYYTKSPSFRSRLLKSVFLASGLKLILKYFSNSQTLISLSSASYPTHSVRRMANIQMERIHQRNVFQLSPKGPSSDTVILYLHGGGFTINFTHPHWNFMRDLIQRNHCRIVAPDFPLLPASHYKPRLDMVYDVYEAICKKTDSKNIILMGDSSGGNMALALAQRIHERQKPTPGHIILLSPWLDVSMRNVELKKHLPTDPMLSLEAAVKVGKLHAGGAATDHPEVSPLYGNLKGIGKISLFTGTADILHPDARKLKALAQEQDLDFNYFEYQSMLHAWMLFGLPEAQLVKEQIAALIDPNALK